MNQGISMKRAWTRKQQDRRHASWLRPMDDVGLSSHRDRTGIGIRGSSPFTTGATAASTNLLAILTPIAVVAVMALGAAAWFNKISWGWAVAGIVGILPRVRRAADRHVDPRHVRRLTQVSEEQPMGSARIPSLPGDAPRHGVGVTYSALLING